MIIFFDKLVSGGFETDRLKVPETGSRKAGTGSQMASICGLQAREERVSRLPPHPPPAPSLVQTMLSASGLRKPREESQTQATETGSSARACPLWSRERTPCPPPLPVSAVHRSQPWKNQCWQGQEKDVLRRFCHLRCLLSDSHSSSLQPLFPHHSQLLRPDAR